MMEIEGVEIRPGSVVAKVLQLRLIMVCEWVEAGDYSGIAGLQTEPGGFLQGGHFAAGMAAEHDDVRFVPRLESLELPFPTAGHCFVKIVGITQIDRETPGICVRPCR